FPDRLVDPDGRAAHGIEHSLRNSLRVLQAALRQHDRELIAAETRADVTRPHLRVDALRHFAQHGIAGEMPVLIVDGLEAVHVDHEAADRLPKTLRPPELLTQARVEVAAVVKAGEEIREPAAQELRAIRGVLQADR